MTTFLSDPAVTPATQEAALSARLAGYTHQRLRPHVADVLAEQADMIGERAIVVDAMHAMLDEFDHEQRGRVALLHSLLQMESVIGMFHVNKALKRRPPSADELIVTFTRLIAQAHQHHRVEWER